MEPPSRRAETRVDHAVSESMTGDTYRQSETTQRAQDAEATTVGAMEGDA
jgi:hypothetical protein